VRAPEERRRTSSWQRKFIAFLNDCDRIYRLMLLSHIGRSKILIVNILLLALPTSLAESERRMRLDVCNLHTIPPGASVIDCVVNASDG